MESWVGQAGTASNIIEDEGAPSGVRVCILSEDHTQASHLQGKYPCTGEATISMGADTKKMDTRQWKYTIITPAVSRRLIAGGASEGCRAKLPRWSFSRSSCTYASGTALDRSMVGSHPQRVKLFCAASRIFGAPRAEILVVAVPLPASFLALSPSGPPLTALSVSGSAPRLEDTAAIHTQKPTG